VSASTNTLILEVAIRPDGVSDPVDLSALKRGGYELAALELPAEWEGGDLTFLGSVEVGDALRRVVDADGEPVAVTASPGAHTSLVGLVRDSLLPLAAVAVASDATSEEWCRLVVRRES